MAIGLIQLNVIPLPPGLVSLVLGEGVNYALGRNSLETENTNYLYTANNVVASIEGIGNLTGEQEGIGERELTGTLLSTAKVQAVIPFPSMAEPTEILIVKGGNVYKMSASGGNETLVAASVFNSDGNVSFQYALGGPGKERRVYIIDGGFSNPQYYNGTFLAEETQFNSAIGGLNFPKPALMPAEHLGYRDRVIYGFPATSAFRNYILASREGNGSDFNFPVTPSIIDAFYEEVYPSDGGYITSINVLKTSNSSDSDTLYVFKNNNKSYSTAAPTVLSNVVVANFGLSANNIGCTSIHGSFTFNNEMYALNNYGIGSFTAATTSGNMEAYSAVFSQRVNPLIKKSSQNSAFNKSFILHCPERNMVLLFMPEQNASGAYQGYNYPEIPLNYSIQYQYSLTAKDGQIKDFWSTRYNKGWAASCGVCVGKRILLGSYFGKVFELFSGNEYERNPADPNTAVPIKSTIETGDMVFTGLETLKSFNDLYFMWQGVGGIIATLSLFFNQSDNAEFRDIYSNVGATVGVGQWDNASSLLWDTFGGWAGISQFNLNLVPANEGKYIRLKLEWNSIENNAPNTALLAGMAGYLTVGNNTRNIR